MQSNNITIWQNVNKNNQRKGLKATKIIIFDVAILLFDQRVVLCTQTIQHIVYI